MKLSSPIVIAYPGPPRRAAGLARYLLVAIFIVLGVFFFRDTARHSTLNTTISHSPTGFNFNITDGSYDAEKLITKPKPPIHPIDTLIEGAETLFEEILSKESHDINTAAAEYRKRRGRHPPPGFDKWFKFAKDRGAVMVEDFFDQIYHDLGPYWGLPPKIIRKEATSYDMTISIRNHNASANSDWFWAQIWLNLTQTIEHLLPDMDIPVNAMDEPRILVPWEQINEYMGKEQASRKMVAPRKVISKFQKLPRPGTGDDDVDVRAKHWETKPPFWNIAVRGCHPNSLARKAGLVSDFSKTPTISLAHTQRHTYQGYVSNFSLSADFCHQPDMQSLHGMMIEPLSVSSTKILTPLFGGSKLPTNNEILLPAPMYWGGEERFSGGDDHGDPWNKKLDEVVWRGVATGGRNRDTNWRGFQRHRFIAMTNSTQVSGAESWELIPENWALPTSQYNLAAQQENNLGGWMGKFSNTGFVDLMCEVPEPNSTCNYTSPYFKLANAMTMGDQFDRKYLPDIDGNSFSGRYRGFLLSTSLPIKATIFKEWHDSRLIAWKHFVPMDNRFMDFYGIMEYFLGYEGATLKVPSHDKEAEKIALAGQEWANKVLRKEDMQIYTLRLLLEYGRLCDDRRDMMGWVNDLL